MIDLIKYDIIPKLIASDHECLQITILYNKCDVNTINGNHTHNYNFEFAERKYFALNNSLLSSNWYHQFS